MRIHLKPSFICNSKQHHGRRQLNSLSDPTAWACTLDITLHLCVLPLNPFLYAFSYSGVSRKALFVYYHMIFPNKIRLAYNLTLFCKPKCATCSDSCILLLLKRLCDASMKEQDTWSVCKAVAGFFAEWMSFLKGISDLPNYALWTLRHM